MADKIIFAHGAIFDCPEQPDAPVMPWPKDRDWRKVCVIGTPEEVKAAFVDGAEWGRQYASGLYDENGTLIETETITEDLSAYSIAGEIVDHRNGLVTVFMGRPTEVEILQAVVDELILASLGGVE